MVYAGGAFVIPALSQKHDTGDGGVKKPVRYGTRVRNKQKKEAHQGGDGDKGKEQEPSVETNSKPLEGEHETEPVTQGATGLYDLIKQCICTYMLLVPQQELLQKIKFLIIGILRKPAQER